MRIRLTWVLTVDSSITSVAAISALDFTAARFHPTVVVMDIRTPELDGIEATRRILAADPATRVLILTTFDLDEYIYRRSAPGPAVTRRVIEQFARIPRPTAPEQFDELTAREREVFLLIAAGLSNAEIGQSFSSATPR
jgi:DNA-binding NarL/FixJ family response regulator